MTSHDVIAYLRRLLGIKKAGHTGTLDPEAAGVLPVCIGKALKTAQYISEQSKVYRAELSLGVETDTQDSSGKVLSKKSFGGSVEEIEKVLKSFTGTIYQTPPMYSALKVDGKRLYELAREGIDIHRKARKVFIDYINILSINDHKVMFEVSCSSGTYIRTLCHDTGKKLECGGHMSFLLRTSSGIFSIQDAFTLEEIETKILSGNTEDLLVEMDKPLGHLYPVYLSLHNEKLFMNGGFIDISGYEISIVRVYDSNKNFIAIGEIINDGRSFKLKPKRIF